MWLLYTHKKEKRNEKRRIWSHRNHNIIVCPFCFNPPLTLVKGSDLFFIFSFFIFLFFPFSGTHQEKGDIDSENWIIFHKELLAELHSLVTPKNHKKKKKRRASKIQLYQNLTPLLLFLYWYWNWKLQISTRLKQPQWNLNHDKESIKKLTRCKFQHLHPSKISE